MDFQFDGEALTGHPGDTLAAALLRSGHALFSRSLKYHRPRGAFCLEGRCSHCLVRIDGIPDLPACQTPLREGMEVSTQNAWPSARHDLLGAFDHLFPAGMDHHRMMAGIPVAEKVMAGVARRVAGLGPLPSGHTPPAEPEEARRIDVAIVGGGPAGRAAYDRLIDSSHSIERFDEHETPSALVLAAYLGSGLAKEPTLCVRHPCHLSRITARSVLFATGTHQPILPFPGNDLPGLYAGRGLARLIERHGVLPGKRVVLIGPPSETAPLVPLIEGRGGTLLARLEAPEGLEALGHTHVTGLRIGARTLPCDLIALCGPRLPAFELPRQIGATVDFDPQTQAYRLRELPAGFFAAGELLGPMSVEEAEASGRAAAMAILDSLKDSR